MKFLKSNSIRFTIKLGVTVLLLSLIFVFAGINKIYNELLNANLFYIFISMLFVILQIAFKAIRWNTVIRAFNSGISLGASINYTLISHAFGIVTPGRFGEFIKAKYLADKVGIGYLKSIMTVIVDKIFDIVTVILFALAGFSFFLEGIFHTNYLIFTFTIYVVILVFVFVYFNKILDFINYFFPKKYRSSVKNLNVNKAFYAKALLFSLFIWMILSMQAFFIIKALNIPSFSFYIALAIVPLMALSSMIPISIGGIGVREVIAIYSFSLIGITAEKSAIFSLVYTFITFGIPAIIGAILYIKGK